MPITNESDELSFEPEVELWFKLELKFEVELYLELESEFEFEFKLWNWLEYKEEAEVSLEDVELSFCKLNE